MTTMQKIALAVRIFLGFIFIYASIDKIINPAAFADVIYNYQILPENLINATALLLPWIELICGICLILGKWLPGSVFIVNGLLIIFTGALIFNMARGLNIHCGCFSSTVETVQESEMLWTVLRDVVFLIPGLFLLYHTFLRAAGTDEERI